MRMEAVERFQAAVDASELDAAAGPGPGPSGDVSASGSAAAASAAAAAAGSGAPLAPKPGPRRGRPPGSKNKNWTNKIVAASYLEQQRQAALQRRAESAAVERAFASLPPHLRAAYLAHLQAAGPTPGAAGPTPGLASLGNLGNLANLANLGNGVVPNPFSHAAVAAAASDAAAAFADRHGAARACACACTARIAWW